MKTTVGQLLLNAPLPPELRDYKRRWTKSNMRKVMGELALKYPDLYKGALGRLMELGGTVSQRTGTSIRLDELKTTELRNKAIQGLRREIDQVYADPRLTTEQKERRVVELSAALLKRLPDLVHGEGVESGNILSTFVESGTRGSKSHVNQLRGSALLVTNNSGQPIPVPVISNFSEGLSPAELWATTYGVRAGYTQLKQATPKAGYFGKQLTLAAHKLLVSDRKPLAGTGLPVDTSDPDNEGSVLAADYLDYKAGTVITPKILRRLRQHHKQVLVHSPLTAVAPGGAVPQLAVGYREQADFPTPGSNIGVAAAQAVAEPLAQSSISSKHIAGVVGGGGKGSSAETQAGFEVVNRMANIPRVFPGHAVLSEVDGTVTRVEPSEGGKYVVVGKAKYFVPDDRDVLVKPGDKVEAGDIISGGLPNPADIVRHKGIGEGRRYFMEQFNRVLKNSGVRVHRRNVELVTRGLINHVKITQHNGYNGHLPDDVVEYDDLAAEYTPRQGSQVRKLVHARGQYLEQPVLHYSIGTRVTPRVVDTLKRFGVKQVVTHSNPPPFEPHMVRAVDVSSHDPDWMVRMSGFNLKRNVLDAVHRGQGSGVTNSIVPRLARGLLE